MFVDIFENLQFEDALVLAAPPGWGKTYRILASIKKSHRRFCFIFPLRALCEEVYRASLEKKINVINLNHKENQIIGNAQLIISTPEQLNLSLFQKEDYIFILDEFHLFYYWGDSFREKLEDCFQEICAFSPPLILLSATFSELNKTRLEAELRLNYSSIYNLDFGNQKLKNIPTKVNYYPRLLKSWMEEDIYFRSKQGTSLIFCAYRSEVTAWDKKLKEMNFKTLTCVGGGAKEFSDKLSLRPKLDFIVATSVVSHGVNLPHISQIYFTYEIKNIDFYIQMLGRGGREGSSFDVHTFNKNYFHKSLIIKGFLSVLLKRFSNKVESLIYCFYAY
jgi:superfamily II DNA helicase RecQ